MDYFSESELLTYFTQICLAVRHVHAKHIVHRDIKSANILLDVQNGELLCILCDFGVGKAMDTTLDLSST